MNTVYKKIFRPVLFSMSPERVHKLTVGALRLAGAIPGGKAVMRMMFTHKDARLEREVLGMRFPNPVGLAAGFDKNGEVYTEFGSLGFGFVEVGTVTPQAQPGNPQPRVFRLKEDNAVINRMGFNNRGLENMIKNLRRRKPGVIVGGNLGKNTATPNENAPADYLKLFRGLYEWVDYFVINVSCPNVKNITALQNTESLGKILDGLFEFRRGQNQYRPILLKISPDLDMGTVDEIVQLLIDTPLDGLVAVNTTTSREGLRTPAERIAAIGNGGLSGAPLTARSLEMVKYLSAKTKGMYPIIAVGGIMTPEDAGALLDAGASLVQVYTGMIYNGPGFVKQICKHLASKDN